MSETKKAKIGRPSDFEWSEEIVEEICQRLVSGEGVAHIVKHKHMPTSYAFYARLMKDSDFQSRITRARELQQDAEADRMLELADEATVDDWPVARLRIWTRMWRASKLAPRKYGNTPQVQIGIAAGVDIAKIREGRKSNELEGQEIEATVISIDGEATAELDGSAPADVEPPTPFDPTGQD